MVEQLWELSGLDQTLALLRPVDTPDASDPTCQREPLVEMASFNGIHGSQAAIGHRRLDTFGPHRTRLVHTTCASGSPEKHLVKG